MKKIISTNEFKPGDMVYLVNIDFHKSGRLKYNTKPILLPVKDVNANCIVLDMSGHYLYRVPSTYYINNDYVVLPGSYRYENDINIHISKTKEEAEEKYNNMLKDYIQLKYEDYKKFESNLLDRFL